MIREGVMISNRYEIMGQIGTGGMADVYRAIDRKLNRYVAMKVLKREFREDDTFVSKFQTEAQSAAGMQHPNIVSVYDVGEDRGLYYIVMELIEGITLKDYIQKKGKLTAKEVISIGVQVCSAMEMAHGRNIIHRDIKPQNIMISKEGKVKVTDFGIAKATSSNTISTNAMGSVHYTSPEQARGGFSDAKSDIYSLGISMYEMITGRLPFDGDSTVSVALKHLQEDIIPPSEFVPKIPYSLEQIILKCTQKSPDRRYADIGQLERDLRRSLVEPDGDFVVIAPFTGSATKMITPEELSQIQKVSGYDDFDDDYGFDDDDDEYERRRARRKEAADADVDPKMNKVMKILTIVVAILFLVVLIFVGGKILGVFSSGSGTETPSQTTGKKQKVPDLVGKTLEEAQDLCDEAGFVLEVKESKPSKKYEKGLIDSQTPQKNVDWPENAKIQVVVSTGKLLRIPSVENENELDAYLILIDAGFQRVNIKTVEKANAKYDKDMSIRTDPKVGEWAGENDEITLYVSNGKVKVPDLANLTKEDAEKALKEQGLRGNATEKHDDKVEKGKVASQETAAETEVEKDTIIEYVISLGPEEKVEVPSGLIGKTPDEVKAALKAKGFEIGDVIEMPNDKPVGTVYKMSVNEGDKVKKGTVIALWVSLGPDESTEP